MLQTFLPLFAMTFFIVLFIVMMQFLWRFIDDLTGKGLEMSTIAELFFYAALSMVPMALPLAVLLASLMTFGNLGEKFELTAMKASGVSLLKAMRPLIILMVVISIGAFFFQNNVLPVAQTKMWTLLYSARQKSPEMEIPEKAFYSQIPGISVYVEEKDQLTGMLHDVMIYDMREGADKTRIIVADSGRISLTSDKTHLLLNLYTGEQFENLTAQTAGIRSNNMPYRRESFNNKDILMPFDANFNRLDESAMRNQYVGKNISELRATIDSVQLRVDSINAAYAEDFRRMPRFGINPKDVVVDEKSGRTELVMPTADIRSTLDVDSVFEGTAGVTRLSILQQGRNKAERIYQEYQFKALDVQDDEKTIRRHGIELQKKFTLSFAVIIFFFIGAPLGAIIRKGGFGMPLVISVFLFIIYYIIDNTGYKLARDGRLDVMAGMWLSSVILLPLGVFLTYKALHDSSVFNIDAYKAFFMRLVGKYPKRTLEVKEFTIDEVEVPKAMEMLGSLLGDLQQLVKAYTSVARPLRLVARLRLRKPMASVQTKLEEVVSYLSNSKNHQVIYDLNKYPFSLRYKDMDKYVNITRQLMDTISTEENNQNND